MPLNDMSFKNYTKKIKVLYDLVWKDNQNGLTSQNE